MGPYSPKKGAHCVRWGPTPPKKGHSRFRPMSIVAKRSPISATAEQLLIFCPRRISPEGLSKKLKTNSVMARGLGLHRWSRKTHGSGQNWRAVTKLTDAGTGKRFRELGSPETVLKRRPKYHDRYFSLQRSLHTCFFFYFFGSKFASERRLSEIFPHVPHISWL